MPALSHVIRDVPSPETFSRIRHDTEWKTDICYPASTIFSGSMVYKSRVPFYILHDGAIRFEIQDVQRYFGRSWQNTRRRSYWERTSGKQVNNISGFVSLYGWLRCLTPGADCSTERWTYLPPNKTPPQWLESKPKISLCQPLQKSGFAEYVQHLRAISAT